MIYLELWVVGHIQLEDRHDPMCEMHRQVQDRVLRLKCIAVTPPSDWAIRS